MNRKRLLRSVIATSVVAYGGFGVSAADAADDVLVVRAAKLYVGDGTMIEDGVVVVRDGKIVAVGKDVAVPKGAKVIKLKKGTITPGLIDANAWIEVTDMLAPPPRDAQTILREMFHHEDGQHHHAVGCCGSLCPKVYLHANGEKCSRCGFPDAAPLLVVGARVSAVRAEQSSEVIPHTRVIDSVNLRSPDFERLAKGGVTSVFVAPDSAAVIGSQGAVVQTGGPMSSRVVQEVSAVKAAMGTDPSRRGMGNRMPFREMVTFNTRRPTSRMGVTWVFRKAFYDAERFAKGVEVGGADTPSEPALRALNRIRHGEIPLRIQARMQHDITTAIRLTEEFGLRFVLEEATEAYRCLDELKEHDVPVVYGPIYVTAPGYRARSGETNRNRLHTFAALLDAGIETALTAQELREEDGLARQAMYAMRNGLSIEQVLPAVTSTPAKLLGLDDRLGTVATGKQADLVLWSGEPFAATSSPAVVLIGGEVVVDRRKR